MHTTELLKPHSIEQVCDLLDTHGREAALHAGGTDLVVRMHKKDIAPRVIIDLGQIPDLMQIEHLADGRIRIGCMARVAAVLNETAIREYYRALHDGLSIIGSVQIRNRATVVGNICNGSPAADSAPPLMVLGARVNIRSNGGRRRLSINEFFKAPGQTTLSHDEFVEGIDLPPPTETPASAYLRLGRRNAVDCAIVGAAVARKQTGQIRVAFGAVGSTPIRAWVLEKALTGVDLNMERVAAAAAMIGDIISPIDDVRASQEYRRAVAKQLFVRATHRILATRNT